MASTETINTQMDWKFRHSMLPWIKTAFSCVCARYEYYTCIAQCERARQRFTRSRVRCSEVSRFDSFFPLLFFSFNNKYIIYVVTP